MLRGHGDVVQRGVAVGFGLGWRDAADGFEQAAVVEPVDLLQCGELDGLQAPPRSTAMDHPGLVEVAQEICTGLMSGVSA